MIMAHLTRIISQVSVESGEFKIPKTSAGGENIANAVRLVFGVAGAIAVIMVSLAGLKYVLSQGNPQETAKAKNTIIYAIIGLLVCIFAFAIVTFVIQGLS